MTEVYDGARTVRSGELTLRVADHGPPDGDVVLLLHGWPDSAFLWRHQVPVLVDAGYRVLAPDQRGFGESSRPSEVSDYHLLFAIQDALAVLDDASVETAHVVGHDWGAAVAWGLAGGTPDRVSSLTAISVGHPGAFGAAGLAQREKSWYMLLFQFEGVAERWLSDDDWAGLRAFTRDATDLPRWIEDLSRPGALTASLNWYRATLPPESLFLGGESPLPPVAVPALGIWGSEDFALTEAQMAGSGDWATGEWRYERVEGIGHWLPVDAPDRVNRLLLEWVGTHRATSGV